jgi:hypothetical protein
LIDFSGVGYEFDTTFARHKHIKSFIGLYSPIYTPYLHALF